jgi:hypothetical protein
MNRYHENDFQNVLECMRVNGFSKKAKNVFYYAPDLFRQDMYLEFEQNPNLTENEFMHKFKKIIYDINYKKLDFK